jgi:hypothetical protein
VRLTRVTVTGSGYDGIRATKVIAIDVTSSGNGVTAPGHGIIGFGGVSGRNLTVTANTSEGIAASAGRISLKSCQVTGNAEGVIGFSVAIVGCTVTGNGGGADLVSARRPRARNSTCGTSVDSGTLGTWGGCTND